MNLKKFRFARKMKESAGNFIGKKSYARNSLSEPKLTHNTHNLFDQMESSQRGRCVKQQTMNITTNNASDNTKFYMPPAPKELGLEAGI